MAKRDYYEVLGVEKSASADEIKKALPERKPSNITRTKNPGRIRKREEKFKEAAEAYEVLSNRTSVPVTISSDMPEWTEQPEPADLEDSEDRVCLWTISSPCSATSSEATADSELWRRRWPAPSAQVPRLRPAGKGKTEPEGNLYRCRKEIQTQEIRAVQSLPRNRS